MTTPSADDPLLAMVREIVERALATPDIDVDQDLIATDLYDSMAIVEIVDLIEDALDLTLPDEEIVAERFRTIRCLTDLVRDSSARAAQDRRGDS